MNLFRASNLFWFYILLKPVTGNEKNGIGLTGPG